MSELEQCMKALEIIGNSIVQKSANYGSKNPKVQKAMAIARASETPQGAVLARRVIQLQRQQVMKAQYGPIIKSMGLDRGDTGDDEWSSQFSKADSEEDLLERLKEIADEKADIIRQIREKRGLED